MDRSRSPIPTPERNTSASRPASTSTKKLPARVKNAVSRLYYVQSPIKSRLLKEAEQKAEEEEKQAKNAKPALCPGSSRLSKYINLGPIAERALKEVKAKEIKIKEYEKQKAEIEEKLAKQHPFAPAINRPRSALALPD